MIRSRQSVREIKEYVAGKNVEEVAASYGIDERSIVKLASNENCLGPSPRAVEAIRNAACDVHVYPSVDAIELREALARRFGMPAGTSSAAPAWTACWRRCCGLSWRPETSP